MSLEKKVPEIRFKGFSGKWAEDKLGQIYSFQYGEFNNNPNNGGQYPVYGANGIIGGYTHFNAQSSAVIGHMGEYAGSVLWAEGKHFVTYNGTIAKPKKPDFNPLFGFFSLVKMNLKKVCGGSGQPFLSYDALERLDFTFPIEKEQTQIGNYFQKLDNLINQHQKKHDKLSNIKKAMLEKMFPKQGETIPEIRFKGFSGSWEESSLAEEAVVTTGYPFDSADFSEDGDLLVVTNGNIQNSSSAVEGKVGNRIASEKVTHLNQYKLNFGDILVTMDGSVGRTAKVIQRKQILAQRVGRLVARNDTEFLYQSLNTGAFLETMTTISHGGTIKHISLSEIGSYIVQVPKDLNEQAKIGGYLKKLDYLIEQHQQQITKLNNIKQACLSKMFV